VTGFYLLRHAQVAALQQQKSQQRNRAAARPDAGRLTVAKSGGRRRSDRRDGQ